jgi:hypothetical protein
MRSVSLIFLMYADKILLMMRMRSLIGECTSVASIGRLMTNDRCECGWKRKRRCIARSISAGGHYKGMEPTS